MKDIKVFLILWATMNEETVDILIDINLEFLFLLHKFPFLIVELQRRWVIAREYV